jgi:hypothetical protein
MNWEAIGAIADSIGAIVVIVTLVYLTLQLRQNTKAIVHSTNRGVRDDGYKWMSTLIENPEVAALYTAGMQGDEQSTADRLRFGLLLNMLFGHWGHAFDAGSFDIVNNSQIAGVIGRPGGASYWQRVIENESMAFSPDFIEHVNRVQKNMKVSESRK